MTSHWKVEQDFEISNAYNYSFFNLSRLMTKPTKWHVGPAKTGIRPVWSESSLSAWRKLRSCPTHWAHSEDSNQTGWMPRLIWVFAGRTYQYVGFVTRQLICDWRHQVLTYCKSLYFRMFFISPFNDRKIIHGILNSQMHDAFLLCKLNTFQLFRENVEFGRYQICEY